MENAIYATLTRQTGLKREMAVVANNIANLSTTGFKREGVVFSEYVTALSPDPSLSMARASGRHVDLSQGSLENTGGSFDFAILGDGFFLIETPEGERLTRAGHFLPSAEGELQTPEGHPLLDAGGAQIVVPAGAKAIHMTQDGTLSADGEAFAKLGLWQSADPLSLRHQSGTIFSADAPEPLEENGKILQGHLEAANTNPILEVARMIEVQRAYEIGQTILDLEDQRIRSVIQTLTR